MIRIENGSIEVKGTPAELGMELSLIIKSLRENFEQHINKEHVDCLITGAFEDSELSNEEIVDKYITSKARA